MTTELTTQTKELLSDLKPKKSLQELLNGVKVQERVDKLLLILLDCSSSMSSRFDFSSLTDIYDNTYTSKMSVSWRILKRDLMPNMQGWTYGVLLFSEFDVYWEVIPTVDTKALITKDTPIPRGMTPMGKALQFAWNWVRSNAKQARFIMLTDGMPNDMSKESILEMARTNSTIPIDTVGIGKGSYDYDPIFLASLSSITGGMFVETETVKELASTILKLAPSNRPLLGTAKE